MTDADALPSKSPSPPHVHAPTSEEIDAVIQMATSSRASPDGRPVPLKDTRTQLFVGNLPYRVRWQDLKDLFRKAGTVLRADVALGPDNRSRGYGTVLLATAEDAGRAVDMFNGYSWQTRVLEVRLDRLPSELNADGYQMPGPYSMQAPGLAANGLPMGVGVGMGMAGRSYGQMGSVGANGALSPQPPYLPSSFDDPLAFATSNLSGLSSYVGTPSLLATDRAISRTLFVGNLPFHVQWQDLKDLFRQAGTILRADVALGSDGRSRGFGTVVYATEADAERAVRVFNGYEFNGRALKVHFDKFTPLGTHSPGPASPIPPAAISSFAALSALNTSTASANTSSLLVNTNGGNSLPISPRLSHASSPNSLSGTSNSAALSRLMSLNNGAGSSTLNDFDYDFAYTYDGLGAGTRDAFESAVDDVSSVFRPTSSSSAHNAFRPTSSSATSTNAAFRPTSSSSTAFRPTSSSSTNAFRPTSSSSVNTFAFRPTSAGSPNTLAAQSLERFSSIPLVAKLASAHSSDSQTHRSSHAHSQSFSQPKSQPSTQTAPRPQTQSQLHAHSTGAIPLMNGSGAPAHSLRSELPTPPSSSGTGSSPNITLAKPAGLSFDWSSNSSPGEKKTQGEAATASSASLLARRPSNALPETPRRGQPRTPPRSQPQSQSHPHHPGPISLPPPSAFPLPAPHTLSPVSPYHHPHMIPPHMIPVMIPSPMHHPMHPHSPLHHPMHPHSPMHHPMHPQSPMLPPGSPMHHPYAHAMAVPMSLMTPHGLPPMTPSMPSFQFHPVQHPHTHPTPHAMFSPGVTMSPGAFWGRPARRGSGWDAAVGAPVRPTTAEAAEQDARDSEENDGEWGGDYFASANPASGDYFSGAGMVPASSSSVIANEIMRDNRGETGSARPYSANGQTRDREVDDVNGVIQRMGGMDLASKRKGSSNPRARDENNVFWSESSSNASAGVGNGHPSIQRAGSDPVQHAPAALGGTRSLSSGGAPGSSEGNVNGERRASFAQVVGGA